MRELTKSMTSYAWAMSLFSLQQMVNVFSPGKASGSFNNVTKATEEEFGDAVKASFRAGDNLQRGLVDVTFGVLTLGMFDSGDRSGGTATCGGDRQARDAVGQSGRVVNQTVDILGQSIQAATQTFGVLAQSLTGIASPQGCGGSRSQPTGWGPVPPPPSTRS